MNEEMLKKLAGGGKSPEEVLAIAKNGELSDEALDGVAGGEFIGGVDFDPYLNCSGCGAVYKSSDFKQNDGCCPNCGAPQLRCTEVVTL